jgi:N-formylglutamate amidohydrolase
MARAFLRTLVIGAAAVAPEALAAPEDFLVVHAGDIPVILTAPHGGEAMAALPRRRGGVQLRDAHTLELTLAVAARLQQALGAAPYVVAAKFNRRVIDANRAAAEAFEDAGAQPLYAAYHAAIARFVAEARQRFPDGALLLDVHGQSSDAAAVFRGTQNGTTVRRLLVRAGEAALSGPESVLGALAAKGYTVNPDARSMTPEARAYLGGFTVQTYSREPDGIDAIQLELGLSLRQRPGFADDLADAIATFTRAHLAIRTPN